MKRSNLLLGAGAALALGGCIHIPSANAERTVNHNNAIVASPDHKTGGIELSLGDTSIGLPPLVLNVVVTTPEAVVQTIAPLPPEGQADLFSATLSDEGSSIAELTNRSVLNPATQEGLNSVCTACHTDKFANKLSPRDKLEWAARRFLIRLKNAMGGLSGIGEPIPGGDSRHLHQEEEGILL